MSSRATRPPSNKPRYSWRRHSNLLDRDPPALDQFDYCRKGVCKRCGLVMRDVEPMSGDGEFNHYAQAHQTRALVCSNNRSTLRIGSPELVPFMPKRTRRRLKRLGIRP